MRAAVLHRITGPPGSTLGSARARNDCSASTSFPSRADSGGGARDRGLQPPSIEPETVAREKLSEMLPRVRPLACDVLHAVGQHAVPVTVIRAEARDVLSCLPECLPQVRGRRVVGLEAHEDLPAAEEVGRIVREPAIL